MSLRTEALENALTNISAASVKSHEMNYETLYAHRDGTVYWVESVNQSDCQVYTDGKLQYVPKLLQVGTGSVACNCDYCAEIGTLVDGEIVTREVAMLCALDDGETITLEETIREAMDNLSVGYFNDETDPNATLKVAPIVSTDCKYGDHSACEGEESALWPDGDFSMRPCSCPCHDAPEVTL